MELRAGYKQSNLGVIPEDWQVRRIGDVCQIIGRIGFRGYTVKDIVVEGRGAISLSPSNIQGGCLVLSRNTYVSWEKWRESPEIQIENGDILLVKTGSTVGKAAPVRHLSVPATVNPQLVVFKKRRVDDEFLGYVVVSESFQNQLTSTVVGGALPTLSQREVAAYFFVCPSSPAEQSAIATALGDADALIASLDALIAKKRDLKQAAMQQLLTGKTRLPRFTGAWEVKGLGDVAQITGGGTPKSSVASYWDGGIHWCTPTDITGTQGKYLGKTERTISAEGLKKSAAILLPPGSLLLCTRATLGEVKIAVVPISTNQGFKSLICHPGISNEYMYYLLLTMKQAMVEKSSGSTFLELSKRDLSALKIKLPSDSAEQIAIAEVLSDMDADLAALEAQSAKASALKQGMMQELLTGRIRLV